ncbi:hypothetical protein BC937DRAFT_94741 [Endogone sp. FLAS-F59071]|nr:hypothetical protein BC937DRAFT_94741 [Endogone sp. FLAS-F59071]|eukprot:RUS20633.1 hypothetical protein BC937DRAFT_94741 [Endogone sp. FLAS-F59071]
MNDNGNYPHSTSGHEASQRTTETRIGMGTWDPDESFIDVLQAGAGDYNNPEYPCNHVAVVDKDVDNTTKEPELHFGHRSSVEKFLTKRQKRNKTASAADSPIRKNNETNFGSDVELPAVPEFTAEPSEIEKDKRYRGNFNSALIKLVHTAKPHLAKTFTKFERNPTDQDLTKKGIVCYSAGLIKEQRDEIARLKSRVQELESSQLLQVDEGKIAEIMPQLNLGQGIILQENLKQDVIPQGNPRQQISANRPAGLKTLKKWVKKLGLSRSKTGRDSDGVI